jgi:hypothetical protein
VTLKRDHVTVIKGANWRKYVMAAPHSQMWAIGTVKVGTQMEGALFLDRSSGRYLLIDKTNAWFELDQEQVRLALVE